MAVRPGSNEGVRVLRDFVCDAIQEPEEGVTRPAGRGANAGIAVSEPAVCDCPFPVSTPRAAELRSLNNAQLAALVRLSASTLSRGELWVIHEIALERSTQDEAGRSKDAEELSRNAMLVTLNRTAEQADAPEP